jgi:hypothetical protein
MFQTRQLQGQERESRAYLTLNKYSFNLGATLGHISVLGPCCEWDPDVDTGDLYSIKPLAKGMLEWLVSNEKFCKDRVDDSAAAEFLWREILVGATDKSRKDKPVDDEPDPKVEQLTEPDPKPKDKGDSAYLLMIKTLGVIADLNPDSGDAVSHSDLLRYFEMVYTWIMFLHQAWHDRLLFVTDNGKFGYTSADIGKGDSVCMLYGGRSMYVLRKRTSELLEYQFISDAYVFGCMNGQVFDLMEEGLVREELFAIS